MITWPCPWVIQHLSAFRVVLEDSLSSQQNDLHYTFTFFQYENVLLILFDSDTHKACIKIFNHISSSFWHRQEPACGGGRGGIIWESSVSTNAALTLLSCPGACLLPCSRPHGSTNVNPIKVVEVNTPVRLNICELLGRQRL